MGDKKSIIEFINRMSEKSKVIPSADILRIQNTGRPLTATSLLDYEEASENPYTDMIGDVEELDETLSSWCEEFVKLAHEQEYQQNMGNFTTFCNMNHYPFHTYAPSTIEYHLYWAWEWLESNGELYENSFNSTVERTYDFSATHIANTP